MESTQPLKPLVSSLLTEAPLLSAPNFQSFVAPFLLPSRLQAAHLKSQISYHLVFAKFLPLGLQEACHLMGSLDCVYTCKIII